MPRKPRLSPAAAAASPLLRRRVVFELTLDQLPLLEAAEGRHGSKREALLAALRAEARAEELERRAEQAEAALAEREQAAGREAAKGSKAQARLERELEQARAQLARRQLDLKEAKGAASSASRELEDERQALAEALAERDEELAEVSAVAFDWLFCARCGSWAPPSEWGFGRTEGGGQYAYHRPCGDHRPGVLGASSWLGQRRT